MGVQPPYMYNAIKTEDPRSPYKKFDPKAVTRASWTSQAPRPKQEGPLVSFNKHPDSYLVMPFGLSTAKPMKPSVKKWIKWTRIIQLGFRCFQLVAALGLLVLMILIKGVDAAAGWIMRVTPGVAIFHTVYAIYHLARRASGRTPGSSSSYMLFASFFDVSIVPLYAFSALVAKTQEDGWKTVVADETLVTTFSKVVFYLSTIGGGLHLFSLAIGLYLAVTFRKITKLPPDMNPLEDNLTSRHKRNKSSVSTFASSAASEKRSFMPIETKRASGAAHEEDLSHPPTIPFFHTRTQSSTSISTYKTSQPPSRDSHANFPGPQYQAVPSNFSPTPLDQQKRTSFTSYSSPPKFTTHHPFAGSEILSSSIFAPAAKHNPYATTDHPIPFSPPPKRASYLESHVSSASSLRSSINTDLKSSNNNSPTSPSSSTSAPWFASDSLSKARSRSSPGKKAKYQPLDQHHDGACENITYDYDGSSSYDSHDHPNPLEANPPTPVHKCAGRRDSPLGENNADRGSGDITDIPISSRENDNDNNNDTANDNVDNGEGHPSQNPKQQQNPSQRFRDRDLIPRPLSQNLRDRAKAYGELKLPRLPAGTPPIMVGGKAGNRQVSSGNDFAMMKSGTGGKGVRVRDVSGKVAEEGRGGGGGIDLGGAGAGAAGSGSGARLRKVSGQ
ncbi:uncharacterized protein L3040_002150 [Drepanopeziza brunnea f. sp. 'multigermtubi']|uniref:Uncharacterized protein n=1 Tax=Marssonina brunnea f. sp. multigermtubi (strain MB_m1) TaxID=1072389 RepID=K1WXL6_MARBU|nr:uncharacterized protein MBM_04150 [Drepanopeziza brunnea f. sp. 'multigermtubi' MB_m1]EKD17781.1 hypothetical protein MBM_04150 [Drepanopeziza brunnea f. sp. 'multigermtubi' MB_m1]KAJ5052400.1 hypothetical protein L3040_002150 [Drepanopeziza brunnea f. sp. 'multigermtubi']